MDIHRISHLQRKDESRGYLARLQTLLEEIECKHFLNSRSDDQQLQYHVEILNNKHIFNGYYPDHVLLRNTYTIHKLLYVDHQFSSINYNKTSIACTH